MNVKTVIALGACGSLLGLAACVSTVDGKHTAAMPFVQDKVVARYQRPLAPVFAAAKDALAYFGTISVENVIGKTLEGKVDTRTVWMRCEALDPNLTQVTTQVRTKMGGTDEVLAAQIDKQLAIFLATGKSLPPPPK